MDYGSNRIGIETSMPINSNLSVSLIVRILTNCTHSLWGVTQIVQNRYLHTTDKQECLSFYLFAIDLSVVKWYKYLTKNKGRCYEN